MLKSYKYKLCPNELQKDFFNQSIGCARVVFNYCLNRRIEAYQTEKKSISRFDLCKEITVLKRKENYQWLSMVNRNTLNYAVLNLDKAFTKFFQKKIGFPNFKSKKNPQQSCQFSQGVKVDFSGKIRFPNIGWIKARLDRNFKGEIKTVTVSKNTIGEYFVSVLIDNDEMLPEKQEINENTSVGIDLGLKTFAVISDGTKIENPRHIKNNEKRLVCLQKRLSKKQIGSKNREKARIAVAKLHIKISNQRKDFLHKISTVIIKQYDTIIVEDLNVKGMIKNHNLAKSISDVSWSKFNEFLKYKCEWYGKNYIKIGRFEPSSKMCTCGIINKDLKLKDRTWTCNNCGVTHDRDLLAANNIKKFGLQKQNLIRQSPVGNGVELVELSTVVGAMKQELLI